MSEDYKHKYDDLMKRCAEFMQEFAPPSSYELGFKAGWEAAKQEFCKDNTYVSDTTKRTTNSWPPKVYQGCSVCSIGSELNKSMSFVCNNPQCPTRVTCSLNVNSLADNNMSALQPEIITTIKTTGTST